MEREAAMISSKETISHEKNGKYHLILNYFFYCIGGIKRRNCYLPLETVNPLKTKTTKIVKEASVLATTFVLPSAAMKRKSDRAI